jgi:hypothetical protein
VIKTKIAVFAVNIIFCLFNLAYAADAQHYKALNFAKEYESEVKVQREAPVENRGSWKPEVSIKSGIASYEESEQILRSHWDGFYSEVLGNLLKEGANDVENALSFSFGQSVTETETWHISDIKYQTNDLNFYRINLKGSLGKILHHDRYENLRVIPFLGYGFRFINFKRANFNILDIITSHEAVTEKYYIHHLDFGIRLDNKLSSRWSFSGLACFGYVVYNQADNSMLGKVGGGEGYLVDGNINLQYNLNDFWQLIFGGFIELQKLPGGEKGDAIWPDNELNICGGNIGMRYVF